ncbi:CPXCG motif-containing cysteine-rich protein [Alcanivorax sp.]|uniref:CPXCG motif-containing cysteine-rich protein n=1 Tax=Alcanivorax sp. TaxID=1872427 RepID=UPI003A8FA0A8
MAGLLPVTVQCPHCWEAIEVLVDPSVEEQEYVEDCQVCCQPLLFAVAVPFGSEEPQVDVRPENE